MALESILKVSRYARCSSFLFLSRLAQYLPSRCRALLVVLSLEGKLPGCTGRYGVDCAAVGKAPLVSDLLLSGAAAAGSETAETIKTSISSNERLEPTIYQLAHPLVIGCAAR